MPRRSVLTPTERAGLLAFPIAEDDLIRHYTLSEPDLSAIRQRRGTHNRLGFAVSAVRPALSRRRPRTRRRATGTHAGLRGPAAAHRADTLAAVCPAGRDSTRAPGAAAGMVPSAALHAQRLPALRPPAG